MSQRNIKKYDEEVCQDIFITRDGDQTRGHSKKIVKERCRLDKRKNSFCNRVVNNWNALPQYVIESGNIIKFELNLDRAWSNQDLLFDHRAKIQYSNIIQIATTTTANNSAESTEPDAQA